MLSDNFKTHCEDVHVPLMKSLMGDHFPINHARRYLPTREPSSMELASGPLKDIDCIAELTWRDQAHFQGFMAVSAEAPIAAKVADDCAQFMDTTQETTSFVVEDYRVTGTITSGN